MKVPDLIGRLTTRQKAIAGSVAGVVVAAVAGTGIALATHDGTHAASPVAAPATTSASPTPRPSSSRPAPKPTPKGPVVNALTGVGAPTPLVAVKIDDVADARPQVGIDRADVVYIEEVEGGLTRLLAVYGTHRPTVGPVRSVRSSDPELLTQYGRITFAVSGGGGDSLPALDRSILRANVNDRGAPGFFRDDNRSVPHNLMLNLAEVPTGAGSAPRSVGWTFAARFLALATAPAGRSVRTVVGRTPVGFDWNPRTGRYVRIIDGAGQTAADGAPVSTPNVIVQFCQGYVNPNDIDPAGNPGHYTKSVGSGRVVVFRNGKRIEGRWFRPTAASGTVLKDRAGRPLPLAPGGAWVALVTTGAPLS